MPDAATIAYFEAATHFKRILTTDGGNIDSDNGLFLTDGAGNLFCTSVNTTGGTSGTGYIVNVKAFGAKGDGVTDDTTSILAAYSAASSGGQIFFPTGFYVHSSTLPIYTKVHTYGTGYETVTLFLKSGSNVDQFSANTSFINLSAAYGTSNTGGVAQFSFQHLTLDGNKAGQTSGPSYNMRFYGYGFYFHDVRFKNGFSGGILCDWNGGGSAPAGSLFFDNAESRWTDVVIHDCNGIGLQMGGPHDSIWSNVDVFNTGSHNIHLAPNAVAIFGTNVVCYGSTHGNNAVAMLVESTVCQFSNVEPNASDQVQLVVLGSGNQFVGMRAFNNLNNYTGIKIGQQAGETPYPGQILQSAGLTTAVSPNACVFQGKIANCDGPNGSVWFDNDGGNDLWVDIFNNAGGVPSTGTINANTTFMHRDIGVNAQVGLFMKGVSIGYTESSTSPAIVNNGTISTPYYIGVQRVSPSANVTGIILSSGGFRGQEVTVRNESAFTVTFDVPGTSHVADGNTSAIPANTCRKFVWSSNTSLWYRAT